jgi:dienelactone hydrolase
MTCSGSGPSGWRKCGRAGLAAAFASILRCALLLTTVSASADPTNHPISSIDALWAGFDPRAVPLDVEVVQSWEEGNVHLEAVYFTSEVFAGETVRVFGYFGRPKGLSGKVPGLLHVHGGGQTGVLDWPRFWASRGYACLSFDFCGEAPGRERFTRWGKVPGDMFKVGPGFSMSPTPRHNPWFHWTIAARRGLTFLETRPEVDPQKLGVFGVSVGGTLTWSIAALDPRVKAAAPIYGCGWEFYPYPPDEKADLGEDQRLWHALVAPEAHAASVRCPLLLLSATNDGHGRMDLAFRTLDRMTASTLRSQVFTRDYDHHVEPDEARSLPLFMDACLKGVGGPWPASPTIEISTAARDGVPEVLLDPKATPDRVARVDVYYSLEPDWPTGRFWRTADVVRRGDRFTAAAPFVFSGNVLTAFASVTYTSGARLSSRLARKPVSEIAGARPTLEPQALIDSMETAADWHWSAAYTDPCREDRYFASWTGTSGERGFTLDPKTFNRAGPMSFRFGTWKIADPQFHGAGHRTLMLDHFAEGAPDKLTVRLMNRPPGQNPTEFSALLPPAGGDGAWRTWRMEPDQFKDAAGAALAGWDRVEQLVLDGTSPANKPPAFRRLRWDD